MSSSRDGISALAPADRPRERMVLFGPGLLSEAELVALIFGGAKPLCAAQSALDSVGGLTGLARSEYGMLAEAHGLGPARAAALISAVELGRRIDRARMPWTEPLRDPQEAGAFVKAALRGAEREHFLVVGLDARRRVRLFRTVAIGSLAQVDVHPRELFRPLVTGGVHACILAHNHPSGDPTPSDADLALTTRMFDVGELLGIPVLDHVIVSDTDTFSLAEHRLMPRRLR